MRWIGGLLAAVVTTGCGAESWSFDTTAGDRADGGSKADAADPPDDDGAVVDAAGTDGPLEAHARPEAGAADAVTPCATDLECGDDAPLCRQPGGVCIRCGGADDCVGSTAGAACDPATGRCVPCTSDTQCASAALPRCYRPTNSCVRCVTTTDCGRESFCDAGSHTCTPMF